MRSLTPKRSVLYKIYPKPKHKLKGQSNGFFLLLTFTFSVQNSAVFFYNSDYLVQGHGMKFHWEIKVLKEECKEMRISHRYFPEKEVFQSKFLKKTLIANTVRMLLEIT